MGIRDSSVCQRSGSSTGTHYPSWGSGTATRANELPRVYDSLPLMGIRNDALLHLLLDFFDGSLPLMGIRNGEWTEKEAEGVQLITPHGDQEQLLDQPGDPGRDRLITPHGDQELNVLQALGVPMPISLPLMGIRNYRGRPAFARPPACPTRTRPEGVSSSGSNAPM